MTSDAITKLCTLPLLAGTNISSDFVVPTVAACVDLVVHCTRTARGRREVSEILALGHRVEKGVIEAASLFVRDEGALRYRGAGLPKADKFARAGIDGRFLEAA